MAGREERAHREAVNVLCELMRVSSSALFKQKGIVCSQRDRRSWFLPACCWTQEANMSVKTARNADLRRILTERRRQVQDEVQSRIRDGLADRTTEGRDDLEVSDADVQG